MNTVLSACCFPVKTPQTSSDCQSTLLPSTQTQHQSQDFDSSSDDSGSELKTVIRIEPPRKMQDLRNLLDPLDLTPRRSIHRPPASRVEKTRLYLLELTRLKYSEDPQTHERTKKYLLNAARKLKHNSAETPGD